MYQSIYPSPSNGHFMGWVTLCASDMISTLRRPVNSYFLADIMKVHFFEVKLHGICPNLNVSPLLKIMSIFETYLNEPEN